jgi:hypothetical protein
MVEIEFSLDQMCAPWDDGTLAPPCDVRERCSKDGEGSE